jgi:nanoRNase/pAp phosphatase (c-di-AMP/oligoRNAs hydrolase)
MADQEVEVHDPVYVVRSRLGDELDSTSTREEEIENMEVFGGEVDQEVKRTIRSDYEDEIGDVMSGLGGGIMGGGDPMAGGSSPLDDLQGDDLSEEEQRQKIQDIMRISSLKLAYNGYPVFKSIVVN